MDIVQQMKCRFGAHHRDGRRVHRATTGVYTSVCSGCGVQLWRTSAGWVLEEPFDDGTIDIQLIAPAEGGPADPAPPTAV
ncbi:hypothetical protein ACFOKI_13770 [Sphingomonas qilianensis]|uniref:CENP-V/GFA domain-containing protein n=1 Tax=Sphingomonas qilianensis TaxID=1736690 RepID=A0ABU9XN05_9SPHN